MVAETATFVLAHEDCFERTPIVGHLTGSAWIVDPAGERALLIRHRKLGKWLQPGGHADGDGDLHAVALREAREETGLERIVAASCAIYDVDVHRIPARPGEPEHLHYDVRYAFFADPAEPLAPSAETRGAAWVPLGEIVALGVDESVLRLAQKTPGLLDARMR